MREQEQDDSNDELREEEEQRCLGGVENPFVSVRIISMLSPQEEPPTSTPPSSPQSLK